MALKSAGENRGELENVLNTYRKEKKDSLKLKSAIFLIENMPEHFTFENETLKKYYKEISRLNNSNLKLDEIKNEYQKLYEKFGDPQENLIVKQDICNIKGKYLTDNIERAVQQWQHGVWAKHLSFEEFCEYLLPYRVGYENIEDWRGRLENRYFNVIYWLLNADDTKKSAYWAALYMNEELKERKFIISPLFPESPVNHPPSVLESMRMGTCYDYAQSAVFIMRACGIPVTIDFTPQWPFRNAGHAWNVVLDNNGRDVPFLGGESNPGYPNKPGFKIAKVYRNTFAYQKQSLYDIKGKEIIPYLFDTPFIKDVSDQYFKGVDIEIQLSKSINKNIKFAYLSVFDNQQWIPIQWGVIDKNRKVCFKMMGKDIVYLPVLSQNSQDIVAVYAPILVNLNGEVTPLIANIFKRQQLVLKRKYPCFQHIQQYARSLVNGQFIASNNKDFKDSVIVGTITRNPLMKYDTVLCNTKEVYRYWGYKPPQDGCGNIAEIEFLTKKNKVPIQSVYCNSGYSEKNIPENAFDNDGLTYFETNRKKNVIIGVDLGRPVSIDTFRFLSRNDDNNINRGNNYELFYWDNNQWVTAGKQIATADSLTFNNVPSNALYLLKNYTKGNEERIFTYENGEQVWW